MLEIGSDHSLVMHTASQRVHSIDEVEIAFDPAPWAFADAQSEAIARHWSVRSRENPSFFDGTVLMLRSWEFATLRFSAVAMPVSFASYLFWREHGQPDRSVRHVFGGAAIIPQGGGVLGVLAGHGTLNAGRLHLPGGFFDLSDVVREAPQRRLDVSGQIMREVREELGLGEPDITPPRRFLVTEVRCEIGIVAELPTNQDEAGVRSVLDGHNARDGDGEVQDVIVFRDETQLASMQTSPTIHVALSEILRQGAAPQR